MGDEATRVLGAVFDLVVVLDPTGAVRPFSGCHPDDAAWSSWTQAIDRAIEIVGLKSARPVQHRFRLDLHDGAQVEVHLVPARSQGLMSEWLMAARRLTPEPTEPNGPRILDAIADAPDTPAIAVLDGDAVVWSTESFGACVGNGQAPVSASAWAEIAHTDDRSRLREALRRRGVDAGISYRVERSQEDTGWSTLHTDITRDDRSGLTVTTTRTLEIPITPEPGTDPLCGLPTRDRLLLDLAHAGPSCAVLFVDLDDLKVINDTYGHAAGDAVLGDVAERMRVAIGDRGRAYRLGGDEFVVMTFETRGLADGVRVGEDLLDAVRLPIILDDVEIVLSASVGVVVGWEAGLSPETVIGQADAAMYEAKSAGKDQLAVWGSALRAHVDRRRTTLLRLRRALWAEELRVYYQPIVEIATGVTVGFESLLRWELPDGTVLPAGDFVPAAEANGLIAPIGEWVLLRAAQKLAQWSEHPDLAQCGVTVNVSAKQLNHRDFVQHVIDVLDRTGVDPHRLILELTETAILPNPSRAALLFAELNHLGVRVALDDFGSGFSSLTTLLDLPVDIIKLDQRFVEGLHTGNASRSVARILVSLGETLGCDVIAEGVETAEQRKALDSINCQYAQGFHLGRPQQHPEKN